MKVKKISVTSKFIFGVMMMFLISTIILGALVYNKSYRMLMAQIKNNGQSIAAGVAATLDGSIVASVQLGDEETESYLKVSHTLTDLMESTGAEFIYTLRSSANGSLEYAIDAQIEDASSVGDVFEDKEAEPALKGSVVSSSTPYTDAWGTHITSYAPIFLDDKVVGAVGVDQSVSWIQEQTSSLLKPKIPS